MTRGQLRFIPDTFKQPYLYVWVDNQDTCPINLRSRAFIARPSWQQTVQNHHLMRGMRDYTREEGFLFITSELKGKILVGIAIAYFAAMVTRYVITMGRYPGRRRFGGTIPIALHCVLATFLFLVGSFRFL